MSARTWDIGDPEPGEDVLGVLDYTADEYDPNDLECDDRPGWGRTYHGDWKGYKGGKIYLGWDELVRRWGPLKENQ